MRRRPCIRIPWWLAAVVLPLLPPAPPAGAQWHDSPQPPVVRPPTPPPVVPSRPVTPPPAAKAPAAAAAAEQARLRAEIEKADASIAARRAEIARLEEEIEDKEYVISTLNTRIAMFSEERQNILAERTWIRESLESYRQELTDNEKFAKVGINMRTAAVPGHPVTLGLIDFWVANLDRSLKLIPELMERLKREYIDTDPPQVQRAIANVHAQIAEARRLADSPQADRQYYLDLAARLEAEADGRIQGIKEYYAPLYAERRALYDKQVAVYREQLSDCMAAKDRLLAMRPTVLNAEDRIRQIELRAVELDKLIQEDVSHRNSVGGLEVARGLKEQQERVLASEIAFRNTKATALNKLGASGGSGEKVAALEPAAAPPAEEKPAAAPPAQEKPAAPAPEKAQEPALAEPPAPQAGGDLADARAKLQQDVDYHLRNRDRAQAELRSIQQRAGTEEQQAALRARIAASEESAAAAGRELTRLGGQVSDYAREDLSDYDPYKVTATDLKLMDISVRQRAENEATEQFIKTREFIFKTTDTLDALELVQKLDRIAGFSNQGGLRDFERLDAVREFRAAVFQTRTQATFAQETLEATLAELDATAYEIGASRVRTGATVALVLGTGALGMTAMAGQIGIAGMSAGTTAALSTQAAAASKVLLVYNMSTGAIQGYSEKGVQAGVEGAAKEVAPINTYIAIRDGQGGAAIAVGLWQDAGNLLQISSFLKTLKTASQASAGASAAAGLGDSDAALNRVWKLDKAQADFLSTQMSAQATLATAALEDSSKGGASGRTPAAPAAPRGTAAQPGGPPAPAPTAGGTGRPAPPAASPAPTGTGGQASAPAARADSLPMGGAWDAKGATVPFSASEGIAGLETLGLGNATIQAALPKGLTAGATMDEVQAAGRDLVQSFDRQVVPALGALKRGGAGKAGAAVGLTPKAERQVEILRGMAEGLYSPVVADTLLRQETGQALAEVMARLSGTVEFVQTLR